MSDSPGLVNFAIGLVNSVINLPDGQVNFFEEFKLQKNCEINLLIKTFLGLVEMMFGLVNVSFSLPKWQAVKVTFFAPCSISFIFLYVFFFLSACFCYYFCWNNLGNSGKLPTYPSPKPTFCPKLVLSVNVGLQEE